MPEFRLMDTRSFRIKEESATMWQDFYSNLSPFAKSSCYFNDFHSWVADEWTSTEATAATQHILDERNGILRLTSAAAENQGNNIQLGGTGDVETTGESWAPEAGKNLWFETRIRGNDVDQNDIFCGLQDENTTLVALDTDYIGFTAVDGSASLNTLCANTSVVSTEPGIVTLEDDVFIKLGFKVSGLTKVEWYINDVLSGVTSVNIPTALMKLSFSSISGEGVANSLDIDYVVVAQDR